MYIRFIVLGLALLLAGCARDEAPNPGYFEALVEVDNSGVYFEEAYTIKNIRAKSLTMEQSIDKQR
ncbi:MAG: hypothetical protein KDC44_16185, partial [Phaeodactylibacter sp.]|nr:hypothetical protein [Phaeodactylibacter sp.]